ncbi:MAG: T9SS type A sorting domain-containing protein, partial [Candidatus Zixiibacteriota bacterium]
DEPLSAAEFVFNFNSVYLTLDSFSTVGTRFEYIASDQIIYRTESGMVNLNFMDFSGWIPPGNGIVFNLFFSVDESTLPQTFAIDTTTWPGVIPAKTRFADSSAMSFIYPKFIIGGIEVLDTPPHLDSIWVADVIGMPGETIELNIYGYNESPLDTLQLALGFNSDNISFVDAVFSGTRGDMAQTKTFNANNSLRQFLITLVYSQTSPLSPGTGILAKVRFTIDPAASPETIIIDSISYLNSQPLRLSVTAAEGDLSFTPFFTAGSIIIDQTTAVGDDNYDYLPVDYDLKQNHPNPFNPSTTIIFDMPKAGNVTIQIFNILGQNVRTLTNRFYLAGTHEITFNGKNERNENLASGVYFYRLDAEGFNQTRKMTLIK